MLEQRLPQIPQLFKSCGTVSIVKSSMRTPRSTSFQVTGVETVAAGFGRTEYTEASVRFQAF